MIVHFKPKANEIFKDKHTGFSFPEGNHCRIIERKLP